MEADNNISLMEMSIEESIKMVDLMVLEDISGNRKEHFMKGILKMG